MHRARRGEGREQRVPVPGAVNRGRNSRARARAGQSRGDAGRARDAVAGRAREGALEGAAPAGSCAQRCRRALRGYALEDAQPRWDSRDVWRDGAGAGMGRDGRPHLQRRLRARLLALAVGAGGAARGESRDSRSRDRRWPPRAPDGDCAALEPPESAARSRPAKPQTRSQPLFTLKHNALSYLLCYPVRSIGSAFTSFASVFSAEAESSGAASALRLHVRWRSKAPCSSTSEYVCAKSLSVLHLASARPSGVSIPSRE
mmetsp:Transcript_1009/g.3747  ORF Transcript_1009/g.3747 Transcript_1009/m.3747 type:complete len:259 (+) Transcript_1009:204-980(+)